MNDGKNASDRDRVEFHSFPHERREEAGMEQLASVVSTVSREQSKNNKLKRTQGIMINFIYPRRSSPTPAKALSMFVLS